MPTRTPSKASPKPAALPGAAQFIKQVKALTSDEEAEKLRRYFKTGEGQYSEGDVFIGVKMGQLFELAKASGDMPIAEIEKLMEDEVHEIRAGAISIMDKASRSKKTSPERRAEFFNLYMHRHDRVNNWDLVDLGCLHMTGCHLYDKPRDILYQLARSNNLWERRTAIVSTCYFIRQGQTDDTFKIGEILVHDPEDIVHKGTGWMLRFAGAKDQKQLFSFLDQYAATMPRTLLRSTIEQLDKKLRDYYMNLKH